MESDSVPIDLGPAPNIPHFDLDLSATWSDSEGFHFRLSGLSGQGEIIVFASTNLVDWETLLTNAPVEGSLDLIDQHTLDSPSRYYHAVETKER